MKYIELMRPIIAQAADMVARAYRGRFEYFVKNDTSLVSQVDKDCEAFLKTMLVAALPGSGFIAEESDGELIQEFTWVIDPIDGTKNFIKGFPYFCISVALMHHEEVIAAMIQAPMMGDCFYAQKGQGAWLNGKRLMLDSAPTNQAGSLIAVSQVSLQKSDFLQKMKAACEKTCPKISIRMCGAAALDLAYVASGAIDLVLLFEGVKWWDVAAGMLLICEAGGQVSQYDGTVVHRDFKTLIAGKIELYGQVLPLVQAERLSLIKSEKYGKIKIKFDS